MRGNREKRINVKKKKKKRKEGKDVIQDRDFEQLENEIIVW